VCYDPKKIGKVTGPIVSKAAAGPPKGLCETDCDLDIDCDPGLWCADQHHVALKAAGYDDRRANCDVPRLKWNFEVCFDPAILKKNGGGGGDPHFRTFDGTKYDFHGQCDLVMARSKEFGDNLGLDLHIRTEVVTGWSRISDSAIRIGEDIFEISNDGSHYFNGVQGIELPIHMAGHYQVVKSEINVQGTDSEQTMIRYEVQLGNNESITFTVFKNMISVKVDALLSGTEGLLGIHGKAGMVGRDRMTVFMDANQMGQEWQVTDTEPMLFHTVRAPQFPERCILPSVTNRRLTKTDRRLAEDICSNVEADVAEFCIQDVMMTGDKDLANAYEF
jgi:von Willebrand factor type D domain